MTMWMYLVILPCLSLLLFLIFKSLRRKNRSQLWLRITASVLATVCFALTAFDLTYNATVSARKGVAILLTEMTETGFDPDVLDSLREEGMPVYTMDRGIASRSPAGAVYRASIDEIDASEIHVFGAGLDEAGIAAFHNSTPKHFIYHEPIGQSGIESISWKTKIPAGEKLSVQGHFENAGKFAVKLVLEGFGTRLDSVSIKADSSSGFDLSTYPKQTGRAVYSLLLIDEAGKQVTTYRIAFEVIPAKPLNLLVLSSSPDFENRFLKSWLFTNSYGIVLRNSISKGKYTSEHLNIGDINVNRFNAGTLSNFDIVLADATGLAAMPASDLGALRNAVEKEGLGLIVKADSITPPNLFFNQPFRIKSSGVANEQQVTLKAASDESFTPLTIGRPQYIVPATNIRNLITDKENRLFAASAIAGTGKIVYTTINNSYSWMLAGDSSGYRQLWTGLINESARRDIAAVNYVVTPALPVVNQVLKLTMFTADSLPFQLNVNNSPVPVEQDFLLPFRWSTDYWPRKPGWQTAQKADGAPFSFYVYGKDEWKALRLAERTAQNKRFSGQQRITGAKSGTTLIQEKRKVPKICFIIIFILSAVYLWIEEKIQGSRI